MEQNKFKKMFDVLFLRESEYYNSFKELFQESLDKNLEINNVQFNDSLMALIVQVYEKVIEEDLEKFNAEETYFMVLVKQYIKSNFLLRQLLNRCEYFDSAPLIRKQLESAARLKELTGKKIQQLYLKVPQIQNTFKKLKKFEEIKKDLSEYTHVASNLKLISFNELDINYSNKYDEKLYNQFIEYISLINIVTTGIVIVFSTDFVSNQTKKEYLKALIHILKYGEEQKIIKIT